MEQKRSVVEGLNVEADYQDTQKIKQAMEQWEQNGCPEPGEIPVLYQSN